MCRYVSLCVLMGPYWSLSVFVGPCLSLCIFMGPNGSFQVLMRPDGLNESLWVFTGPASLWDPISLFTCALLGTSS